MPPAIADTVFVSPLSTSVSFVSTLPVGFVPAAVPASTAVAVSFTPTGASFAPVRFTVKVRVTSAPSPSVTVTVNTSLGVWPAASASIAAAFFA